MSNMTPSAIGYALQRRLRDEAWKNVSRARRKAELEVWRRAYEKALGAGEQDSTRLRSCADSALQAYRVTRDALSGPSAELAQVIAFLRNGAETLRAGGADASATIYDEIAALIEQHWSARDAALIG